MRRPYARIAVRLQLQCHRIAIGLRTASSLFLSTANPVAGTEQLLNVMAHLMRDHISLGEIPRRAEAVRELVEELQIQIDAIVARTIERPHCRLSQAALCAGRLLVKHEPRRLI